MSEPEDGGPHRPSPDGEYTFRPHLSSGNKIIAPEADHTRAHRTRGGSDTVDPSGGDHDQQARSFAPRAVLDGAELTGAQGQLARAVIEVVLPVGLPPYNIEAAADGEEVAVCLAPVPGRRHALRVLWRQDTTAAVHLSAELVHAHQAAMHQALGTILSAHRFWGEDGPAGVLCGRTRPGVT